MILEYEYLIGFSYIDDREGFNEGFGFNTEEYLKILLPNGIVVDSVRRNRINKIEIIDKKFIMDISRDIHTTTKYIGYSGFISAVKSYYKYNKRKSIIESL